MTFPDVHDRYKTGDIAYVYAYSTKVRLEPVLSVLLTDPNPATNARYVRQGYVRPFWFAPLCKNTSTPDWTRATHLSGHLVAGTAHEAVAGYNALVRARAAELTAQAEKILSGLLPEPT